LEGVQSGDVVFYKAKGVIGRIICFVTRSPYSHVALAVDSDTILESNRFIATRLANIDNGVIHHVYRLEGVTEEQRKNAVSYAMTTLGTKYDYLQILGLFFRYVLRFNYLTFNTYNRFICSENIDYSFIQADIPRRDLEHLLDISPQELLEKYPLYRII
jgi:hypothetical protein